MSKAYTLNELLIITCAKEIEDFERWQQYFLSIGQSF